MAQFFKHGSLTVSLDGIRYIREIKANPRGGAPRYDEGILIYTDGTELSTSLEFVQALLKHIAPLTVS